MSKSVTILQPSTLTEKALAWDPFPADTVLALIEENNLTSLGE